MTVRKVGDLNDEVAVDDMLEEIQEKFGRMVYGVSFEIVKKW